MLKQYVWMRNVVNDESEGEYFDDNGERTGTEDVWSSVTILKIKVPSKAWHAGHHPDQQKMKILGKDVLLA